MKKTRYLGLLAILVLMTGCSVMAEDSVTLTGAEYEKYMEDKEKLRKIDYLVNAIEDNYLYQDDLDRDALEDGLYKGLFASLDDPYSVYYNEQEFKKLTEDNQGEFGGVGIQITAQEDGYITVIAPIAGTPADRAGIKAEDKIIAINGDPYYGSDLEDAVDTMRGEPGTDVDLTIRRAKGDSYEDMDLTITREIIKVESVHGQKLGNYHYVRLSSFDENTAIDFKDQLDEAVDSSYGMIIDLRNNPGGLLDSVVEIADLLLPKGEIVSTVDNAGNEKVESSDAAMVDIPLVVLVNQGSASASEILAGALKDYDRSKIVGAQTFGKGVVQQIFSLDEGGYKITVSEYFTPSGQKIHDQGVSPDVEIELGEDAQGIGPDYLDQDIQLQKAIEVLDEELES